MAVHSAQTLATVAMLGALAVSPGVRAVEYFVDSEQGNDAWGGTTPAAAWRTLARVNTADLHPGDAVRFRRGAAWRGTLVPKSGAPEAPVSYVAYGEGEKPLLLGSVAFSAPEDWEPAAPGIWATRAPEYRDGAVLMDYRDSVWTHHQEGGADVGLDRVPGAAGVVYRVTCRASGSRSNHIQIWGPFPEWDRVGAAGYVTLRCRMRSTIPFRPGPLTVRRGSSPWTGYGGGGEAAEVGPDWQDLSLRLNLAGRDEQPRLHFSLGGVLPAGAVFELQPLDLLETTCSQAMPLAVDVGNIIFDHGKACGWKRWGLDQLAQPLDYWYDAASWRVFVRSDGNPAVQYRSIELALRRHIVNQGGVQHVVYDGLALRYGAAHGFGGGDTAHIIIRNCDIAYIGGGHQHTREDGKPVRFGNGIEFWGAARHHLVEGCRLWEIYDAALTNQGRSPTSKQIDITYRNNIVWNCEYSFEYWNHPETAETRDIRFVNNTCVNAGVVWSHEQRPDRNGSHLMFYSNTAQTSGIEVTHNVFYQSTEWGSRFSAGWNPRPVIDHNLWYEPDGYLSYFFREKLPAADIEGYRARTEFDRHSVFADPLFVDVGTNDFRLRADSPGRRMRPDGGPVGATLLWLPVPEP